VSLKEYYHQQFVRDIARAFGGKPWSEVSRAKMPRRNLDNPALFTWSLIAHLLLRSAARPLLPDRNANGDFAKAFPFNNTAQLADCLLPRFEDLQRGPEEATARVLGCLLAGSPEVLTSFAESAAEAGRLLVDIGREIGAGETPDSDLELVVGMAQQAASLPRPVPGGAPLLLGMGGQPFAGCLDLFASAAREMLSTP
jgi:hypothetical protein